MMIRAAMILLSLATPAAANAQDAAGYWDSVLARGVVAGNQPCAVAAADAMAALASVTAGSTLDASTYLPWAQVARMVSDEPGAPERMWQAALAVCFRQLGQWGADPTAQAEAFIAD